MVLHMEYILTTVAYHKYNMIKPSLEPRTNPTKDQHADHYFGKENELVHWYLSVSISRRIQISLYWDILFPGII